MSTFKRTSDGGYLGEGGWLIRKHCDTGRWVIINPETGGVFDSSETLAGLRKVYGTPRRTKMPSDAQFMAAIGPCGK